ncbi:MAG: class I SAM-dependent methyltransferase [Spirochaetales bacterium]|nr:class I SAM-dependent methyltransferase [Spirochaetales bacterium]
MNSTTWDRPDVVAGFASSSPNAVLMAWVRKRSGGLPLTIVDIGCGAGRNSIPLAQDGHRIKGVDRSEPMIEAARRRAMDEGVGERCEFHVTTMDRLLIPDQCADIVIAHGIWNLSTTDQELKNAIQEAARIAKPGSGLFVFTFSLDTLADDLQPTPGQIYVYHQFSGSFQVFLSEAELDQLLDNAGFDRESTKPLTRYNYQGSPAPGTTSNRPVIWEGTWVRR